MGPQERIGVDGEGVPDKRQHRDVVCRIRVRRAAREVEPLAFGDGAHRLRLGEPVERSPHELAGVDAPADLRDGAECACQPEVLGDDGGQLDRGGGDQPHPLTGIEVILRERQGAGDEFVGHLLVEDLLAEVDEFIDPPPRDERECGRGGGCHVLEVLGSAQHEPELAPPEVHDLTCIEEAPACQPHGEVEDARPAHDRVVDVEERRCGGVHGRSTLGHDLGRSGGRLAGMAIGGEHGRATNHSARLGGWPMSG